MDAKWIPNPEIDTSWIPDPEIGWVPGEYGILRWQQDGWEIVLYENPAGTSVDCHSQDYNSHIDIDDDCMDVEADSGSSYAGSACVRVPTVVLLTLLRVLGKFDAG